MASRGVPRWKLTSDTALASGQPPSSTPATASQGPTLASASNRTSPASAWPSAPSTVCLQSMKKSLSLPEASTTRCFRYECCLSSSSNRAREADDDISAPLLKRAPGALLQHRDGGRGRTRLDACAREARVVRL